jgi:hypothetical protein
MLLIPVFVFTAPHSHWHNTVANDVGIGAFFIALAGPGLWMARRLARTGLWMSADGIIVRNPLRTYSTALGDVDAFAPGVLAGGNNGTPCPVVKQRQGRPVGVWALGREGVIWRYGRYAHELEPLCEELNAVLGNLRAGRIGPRPTPAR